MLAAGIHWGTIANGCLAALLAIATVVLGVPAWQLARESWHRKQRAAADEERSAEIHSVAQAVAKILGVPSDPDDLPEPSPDHPTLIDLLTEMRDNSRDTAETQAILAHHIADGHGPPLPDHLRQQAPHPKRR